MRTRLKVALGALVVAALCLFLLRRSSIESTPETSSLGPFEAWREASAALKASPDYLAARADDVVASGDPTKIYEFVRDNFTAQPTDPDGFTRYSLSLMRWGPRATLRGGAGTPRDIVELLVLLYRRAGFDARVVHGQPDARLSIDDLIETPPPPAFRPAARPRDLGRWQAALLGRPGDTLSVVDPDRAETRTLVEQLMDALPAGTGRAAMTASTKLGRMPLARVLVDGGQRYANPFVKDGVFGESYTIETPVGATSPYDPAEVELILEGARSDAPMTRFELARGKWSIADLAGRRIEIRFPPAVGVEALPGLRFEDVETVIPVMRLLGADLSPKEGAEQSVVGTPVTIGGDVVRIGEDGSVEMDGDRLAVADPDAKARVASLNVVADAGGWPRVDLRLEALDEAGRTVPGLGADAFDIKDEGTPESFVMRRNSSKAPRIVFLLDRSTSLPEAYRGGAMTRLALDLASRIKATAPDASFRVGTVFFGVDWEGPWTGDLGALETQLDADSSGDSDFWQALAVVASDPATLVLLVTDAQQDPTGDPGADEATVVAGGTPVLAVGVGDVEIATLDKIAALSGGEAFLPDDAESVVARANALLDQARRASYLLSFRAAADSSETGAEREVAVDFDGGRLSVAASYEVPEQSGPPAALSGLYLTIHANGRTTTRTLAGQDANTFTRTPGEESLDAVREMLFGRVVLSFEGPGPTVSAALDDWYQAKLRIQPLWDAANAEDDSRIGAALETVSLAPPELMRLAGAPARHEGVLTYEATPEIVLVIERPEFGTGIVRTVDMFPFSRRASVSRDGAAAWRATLEDGAYRTLAETALMGEGTYNLLRNRTLTPVSRGDVPETFGALPQPDVDAWRDALQPYDQDYITLAPTDGTPLAFYAIHKATGDLVAVMPDGSGSARQELERDMRQTLFVVDVAGELGGVLGIPTAGVWRALEETKAKLTTTATITRATMQPPRDLGDVGKATACDLMKEAAGTATPVFSGTLGEAVQQILDWDSYLELAGGLTGMSTPTVDCGP